MKCDSPYYVNTAQSGRVPIPCGKCPNCKKRLVSSWAFRLEQEDKVSKLSLFLTLTYDTRTIPITENGFLTLDKKDVQNFLKRLRKNTGKKLSYFAVGEYGSTNKRPHYHLLMFCKDLIKEDEILDAWKNGTIHVGHISGASVKYTLKYVDKPGKIPAHKRDDRKKEFRLMSKGLGENYVTPATKQYHKADLSRLYTVTDGFKVPMSKYYRKKIYTQNELDQQTIIISENVETEENRQRADWQRKNPSGDYDEYLSQKRLGRYQNFYNSQKKRK